MNTVTGIHKLELERAVAWVYNLALLSNYHSLQEGWDIDKLLADKDQELALDTDAEDAINAWTDCLWVRCIPEIRIINQCKTKDLHAELKGELRKTIERAIHGDYATVEAFVEAESGEEPWFLFPTPPADLARSSVYAGVAMRCIELHHRLEDYGSLDEPPLAI